MNSLSLLRLVGRETLALSVSFALTAALLFVLSPLTPRPEKPREYPPIRLLAPPAPAPKAVAPSPSQPLSAPVQIDKPEAASTEPEPQPVKVESAPATPPRMESMPRPEVLPPPVSPDMPEPAPQIQALPEPPTPGTTGKTAPERPEIVLPEDSTPEPAPREETRGPFQLADLDQPPGLLKHVEPLYPKAARRRQIEGSVVARFVVDAQGNVGDISIVAAEPEGLFEESVLQALRQWRFSPGQKDGHPVPVLVEAPIRFELRR